MAAAKRPAHRPTIIGQVHDAIVQAIRAGNYVDDAASYAGVSTRSVFGWLERGRLAEAKAQEDGEPIPDTEAPFVQFLHDVESARSQAVVRNVALIQRAAETQWQAAAWYLERTNPRKWGRHETVALTGEDGGPVKVEHSARETLAAKFAAAELAAREAIEASAIEDESTPRARLREAK